MDDEKGAAPYAARWLCLLQGQNTSLSDKSGPKAIKETIDNARQNAARGNLAGCVSPNLHARLPDTWVNSAKVLSN